MSENFAITAIYAYPKNGYAPAKNLTVGQEYLVEHVDMGSFYTYITLKNINGSFNSVQFDFYENGKLIDIYTHPCARRSIYG